MLSSGDKLGQYEILRCIGAGGMGEVFRARDSRLGRDVAIKVLPAGMAGNPRRGTMWRAGLSDVSPGGGTHRDYVYSKCVNLKAGHIQPLVALGALRAGAGKGGVNDYR